MMLILSLGYLACLILQDTLCIVCFSFCFLIYLYERFKDKRVLFLFLILMLLSIFRIQIPKTPDCGIYYIIEIKKGYYVASNNHNKVLVQTNQDLSFQDQIEIKHFEPIHTDDNFTLLSFAKYNQTKNIFYKTKDIVVVKHSHSLKSKMYQLIKSRKNADVCLSLYYGIHNESIDQIYTMLGYGYMSAYYIVFSLLKRKYDEKHIRILLLIFSIGFGSLFVYTLSLSRFILYQLSCLCFKTKENQIASTILLFSTIYPTQVLSVSFVVPLLLQFVSYFCVEHKWIVQKLVLVCCLMIYFKKINLASLFCYNLFRKLYGLLFLFGLFIPKLVDFKLMDITLHYAPQTFFIFSFIMIYIQCLKHFQYKYLCILLIPLFEIFCCPFFQVYTLNIGQADCSIIVEPFRKSVVMIDCGQNLYRDNVESIIVPFLENKNIKTIDTLILTHDDYDHSGGYESLKDKVKINQVIRKSDQKVHVNYPFYLLLKDRIAKDENDTSIISYFTYDDFTYLFMGDASKDIEKQLLDMYDLKADIIKVGHHGSNTSSDEEFLNQLDCRLAIISAGYKNKYNHPSTETLKNLQSLNINTLCTNTSGSMAIYTLHHFGFVVTNDGMFGIIII